MTNTAAAASLMPEALPAVTVPSFYEGRANFAIFSIDVSIGRSSVSKTTGSLLPCGTTTGTISSLNLPALIAARAL